jgi:hypothetical protein
LHLSALEAIVTVLHHPLKPIQIFVSKQTTIKSPPPPKTGWHKIITTLTSSAIIMNMAQFSCPK